MAENRFNLPAFHLRHLAIYSETQLHECAGDIMNKLPPEGAVVYSNRTKAHPLDPPDVYHLVPAGRLANRKAPIPEEYASLPRFSSEEVRRRSSPLLQTVKESEEGAALLMKYRTRMFTLRLVTGE